MSEKRGRKVFLFLEILPANAAAVAARRQKRRSMNEVPPVRGPTFQGRDGVCLVREATRENDRLDGDEVPQERRSVRLDGDEAPQERRSVRLEGNRVHQQTVTDLDGVHRVRRSVRPDE